MAYFRTDKQVENLKPQAKRYTVRDADLRGHYVRVGADGGKSFVAVARDPYGKQTWATVGGAELDVDTARERAREVIRRIKAGLPAFEPVPEKPDSFKVVAESYLKRHVEAKGLRSRDEIERILKVYVYPHWQNRAFDGIRRSDLTRLLDRVEDENGPRQADYVLAVIRAMMNWRAARSDEYLSPVTRRMRRSDPTARNRARILDDDEIRIVWKAAESSGMFGAFIQLALLTAQRRGKLMTMRWADLLGNEWRIAAADREKGTGGALVLPEAAFEIIQAQPRIGKNPYVFPGRQRGVKHRDGKGHFMPGDKLKRELDKKVHEALCKQAVKAGNDPKRVEPLPHWTLHDLRRTARSLMSRAGVRPDIAERVMGHVIAGVEGVYDRHSYRDEKADALEKLAGLVGLIINPPEGNVIEMREASA